MVERSHGALLLARISRAGDLAAGPALAARTTFHAAWSGVRVSDVQVEPGAVPEGHFVNHVVALHLGPPAAWESSTGSGRTEVRTKRHHTVSVHPANVLHAGTLHHRARSIVIELSPALAGASGAAGCGGPEPAVGLRDPFAAHVILALAEHARSGGQADAAGAEGLGAALLSHLLRRRPRAMRRAAPRIAPARLRRVLEHISDRLDRSLTLRELATIAEMDLFRFVRAFKEATGLPPHRYVLEARVERAKSLLADRGLSVSEVALRVGFATPSHFSAAFRRLTDATPREFRDALG